MGINHLPLLDRWFQSLSAASVSRQRWYLLSLALLVFAAGIGLRDPWQIDELRYAGIAKEMLQSGDWWIPHRAGEIYAEKPPLYFWLLAISIGLCSSATLGFLLPSLLSGVVSIGLFHDLVYRLFGQRAAWYGGLMALCSYQLFKQMKSGQIDALLFMLISLSCYGLARHLLLSVSWRWCYLAFFTIGLGIITKGVGFLPLLMFIPYIFGRFRGYSHLTNLAWHDRRWLLSLSAMLAGISIWLGPVVALWLFSDSPEIDQYLQTILFKQTAQRYSNAWHHVEPWWFFIVSVIPLMWQPSILFIGAYLSRWRRMLADRDGRLLVFLGWVLLVLLFFSMSSGKRTIYILPALFGWLVAVAALLPDIVPRRWYNLSAYIGTVAMALIFAVAGVMAAAGNTVVIRWVREPADAMLILFSAAAWLIAVLFVTAPRQGSRAFVIGFIGLSLVYGFLYIPAVAVERTTEQLQRDILAVTGRGATLVLPQWDANLWYDLQLPMVHFGYGSNYVDTEEMTAREMLRRPDSWTMLQMPKGYEWDEVHPCFSLPQAPMLVRYVRKIWYLLPASAARRQCVTGPDKQLPIYHFRWDERWR